MTERSFTPRRPLGELLDLLGSELLDMHDLRLTAEENRRADKAYDAIRAEIMTYAPSSEIAPKYHLPPADANGKRPRLFYYEEAENAWCPAEGLEVDNIIGVDLFMVNGDVIEIKFKREDMTDEEFDALPEA